MLRNCINSTDMTLISQRRMGKTGLILRLLDELKISQGSHNFRLPIRLPTKKNILCGGFSTRCHQWHYLHSQ